MALRMLCVATTVALKCVVDIQGLERESEYKKCFVETRIDGTLVGKDVIGVIGKDRPTPSPYNFKPPLFTLPRYFDFKVVCLVLSDAQLEERFQKVAQFVHEYKKTLLFQKSIVELLSDTNMKLSVKFGCGKIITQCLDTNLEHMKILGWFVPTFYHSWDRDSGKLRVSVLGGQDGYWCVLKVEGAFVANMNSPEVSTLDALPGIWELGHEKNMNGCFRDFLLSSPMSNQKYTFHPDHRIALTRWWPEFMANNLWLKVKVLLIASLDMVKREKTECHISFTNEFILSLDKAN